MSESPDRSLLWKTAAWQSDPSPSATDRQKAEDLMEALERSQRMIFALLSQDVYPIIEYLLNEGLMTEEEAKERMDLGFDYWRDELIRLVLKEHEDDLA